MREDPVEFAMAFEESLLSGDERFAVLKPHLLERPKVVSCIKGGFELEVVIYALYKNTALFVSLEAAQFGVGTVNVYDDVIESTHYPNATMALRAFVGATSRS